MIVIKTRDEITRMRASNALAGEVRRKVADAVRPGVTTWELGDYARELIEKGGAKSGFYGYYDFPGQICISINDEVVHGIPSKRRIELGDIVSLDIGVLLDGFYGDTATTVMVGVTDPDVMKLVRTTKESLDAGLAKVREGARLSDVSHAIQKVAEGAGFSVVRDFVGHGIGRELHEDPQIPNFGRAGRGPKLRAGMTLAIEPMVNMGKPAVKVLDDQWTVVTKDGSRSAHIEHTVLVTVDGVEILTK